MKSSSLKFQGFSLVELMVVIGIVGILAAIAIPSYDQSIRRGGYTETKTELQELMRSMEEYYIVNNFAYTDSLNTLTGMTGTLTTQSGQYVLSAKRCSDGQGGTLGLTECVALRAVGPARLDDSSKFETFEYDTEGNRTYNGEDGWLE